MIYLPGTPVCSDALPAYNYTFGASASEITLNLGRLEQVGFNYTAYDVPINEPLEITMYDEESGCSRIEVVAPMTDDDCDFCANLTIEAPVSGGDQGFCEGDSEVPLLSVTVNEGVGVNWYDAPQEGNLLAENNTSFSPINPGTYYAEAYDLTFVGCLSDRRTPVSYIIYEPPTYALETLECGIDGTTYAIIFATDATSVTADLGTIVDLGGGRFSIPDIPIGEIVTIALSIEGQCTLTVMENSNGLDCDPCNAITVNPPTIVGEEPIQCEGDAPPTLEVAVETGQTANWYKDPTGGEPLVTNSLTYTPEGPGVYYAEAIDAQFGCTSATRTSVTNTLLPLPTYTFLSSSCAPSERAYLVIFETNATTVQTGAVGTLIELGNNQYQVIDIPIGTPLTLTLSSVSGCTITETLTSEGLGCDPCSAAEVAPPITDGDQELCEEEGFPTFVSKGR